MILALHVLVALAVSAHALLRKSDVRSALGWVAVAWFSFGIGAALYVVLGINRISRKASRLAEVTAQRGRERPPSPLPDAPPHIAKLAEIGLRVSRAPLLPGNRVEIKQGGREAYAAMLTAIRTARHSVALASYIFRHDDAGRYFVEALVKAHQRGVEVRVLLDGIGAGYFRSPTQNALRAAGVPCARFLHSWAPWRMPLLNLRNHKKLLVVDGTIGFTGGLNIGIENVVSRTSPDRVDDVHVRIEGPAARQLLNSFAQDWQFTTGEAMAGDAWWQEAEDAGPVFARGLRSGPDADLSTLETMLGAALAQAHERVRIVSPYFLPDQRLQFALAQARLRGVEVEIVVPERTDHIFMDWAMRAHFRFLRNTVSHIHLGFSPFNHAKLMTVDGAWCLIGSSNWDTRSLRLNFEFDLECYDRALCAELDALIDDRIAASRRLTHADLAADPLSIRLRDAATRLFLPYL